MIKYLSKQITQSLIKKNVIMYTDYEIYYFGIFQMILNIVDTFVILLMAFLFHKIVFTCSFLIAFAFLRKYAGGFHAKTVQGCFFVTLLISLFAILGTKYLLMPTAALVGIWGGVSIAIISLVPVQNSRKVLDEVEKVVYRKRALTIWGIESVVMFIFMACKLQNCFEGVFVGQCCVALAVCVGIVFKE